MRFELLKLEISCMKDLVGVFKGPGVHVQYADILSERFRVLQICRELIDLAFVCE
jgi:hypothetical protein